MASRRGCGQHTSLMGSEQRHSAAWGPLQPAGSCGDRLWSADPRGLLGLAMSCFLDLGAGGKMHSVCENSLSHTLEVRALFCLQVAHQ